MYCRILMELYTIVPHFLGSIFKSKQSEKITFALAKKRGFLGVTQKLRTLI